MNKPPYDEAIEQIAEYVCDTDRAADTTAAATARLCLLDALACAAHASTDPACLRTIAPAFGHTGACPVPATDIRTLLPEAAFATGVLIRWLDFNDAWLAREWGHPSDTIGALLPLLGSAACPLRGGRPVVADLLTAMVQAYEIQGVLACGTALNRHGLDHVVFVRVAVSAVATGLLGGTREDVARAVAHAWADGGCLRVYRHAPNVTWRKSWAAGDAARRALQLADLAMRGAEAPRTPLTAPGWGFSDALLRGEPVTLPRPLGASVMPAVLLKPWFPAEFHGQSTVEAAFALHRQVSDRVADVTRVEIRTHESAMRIIDKTGPLAGPADRDHCLQYMVAVALLRGELRAADYDDGAAADPRIDRLRAVTTVAEDERFTREYLDPERGAAASALRVHFHDGEHTEWVEVSFPVGHPARRAEATDHVDAKLRQGLQGAFGQARAADLHAMLSDPEFDAVEVRCLLEALALTPRHDD